MIMNGGIEEDYPGEFTLQTPKQKECAGLIFRGYRSFFLHGSKVELRQGVRLLKRKSCPGCERCGWLLDALKEDLNAAIMPDIEDGVLYGLHVINESRDWETGYVDAFDLEFFKVEEEA